MNNTVKISTLAYLYELTPNQHEQFKQFKAIHPELSTDEVMDALGAVRRTPNPYREAVAGRPSRDTRAAEELLKHTKRRQATDQQVGGDHYKSFPIQPAIFTHKNKLTFLEGCVVKRVARHSRGGKGRQDIEKAIHELQMILELEYGDDQAP